MTVTERIANIVVWLLGGFAVVFLMTPLVVTVAASFGSAAVFTLPPPEWSLRWYERLTSLRGLGSALLTSVQIAGLSTAIALVLGTMCAIGLSRGKIRGSETIISFLISPLMLPALVIGIALLQFFREVGLRDAWTSLLLAHVVITLPYVTRTVIGSLSLFDFTLIDAARTLGCSYVGAVRKVLIPNLAPAFMTSGMFAFLASMDNYPISIFFTDAWTKTLPIQMLQFVEERPDPTIAAISTCLIVLAVIVMIIGDRLVGIRRMAQF